MKIPFHFLPRPAFRLSDTFSGFIAPFCRTGAPGRPVLLALLSAGVLSSALPLARAQETATLTTLDTFASGSAGEGPLNDLVLGRDGNFYGTTYGDGATNFGTVFQLTPAGVFTVLHAFKYSDGAYPQAGLVQGSDGNFYGTTAAGGTAAAGTIFQVTPTGVLTTLHNFSVDNGDQPQGDLVQDSAGNFYGTTAYGGANGDGLVFQITSVPVYTILYNFSGPDGNHPTAGLALGRDGNFYGTTAEGGADGVGTVFQITPAGVLTTLYNFSATDGSDPVARLAQGADGNFYGTTAEGGASDYGTVFRITSAGALTTLYSFTGGTDGGGPEAGLVQGGDGNFYGTAFGEGAGGDGTVFQITPTGVLTTLYSFSGIDGADPAAALALDSAGNFYGTTYGDGINNDGTIFKLVARPAFFNGETALSNGVYYLAFPSGNYFGYYSFLANPAYIYHFDLGYEYVFDANDGNDGVYFYDFASSDFFYTSPTFPFPYLFDFNLNSVVYYYPDPSNPGHYNTDGTRYFYVFNTGQTISK